MNSIVPSSSQDVTAIADDIDRLIDFTLRTLASERSRNVYRLTYDKWVDWCSNNGVGPLEFLSIGQFLSDQHVAVKTRKRMRSAMRTLLKVAAIVDSDRYGQTQQMVSLLSMPTENIKRSLRKGRALTPDQVRVIQEYWSGDSNQQVRNRAIVATFFATGMRRFELANIRWDYVDLEAATIYLEIVKGSDADEDRSRFVVIVGTAAIDALREWHERCYGRSFAFCAVNKAGKLGDDTPMTVDAVHKIIKKTERGTGIHFATHDARRTFASEASANGADITDLRDQLGHKNMDTTSGYIMASKAEERRKRLRTRYGD